MPTGEDGDRASLFFLSFFSHSRDLGFSQDAPLQKGASWENPSGFPTCRGGPFNPDPGAEGRSRKSNQGLAAAFPVWWLPDS